MNCVTNGMETASAVGNIRSGVRTCLVICTERVPADTPPYETKPTGL